MNSLTVHRVIIGALVIVAGFFAWKASVKEGGHDGNPSGLDIVANQKIAAIRKDNSSNIKCLQSTSCSLYVEFHYLSLDAPVPQCLPNSQAYVCPASLPTQPPYPDRALRTCQSGELCISANTADTGDVSGGTPLTVDLQDADGWRRFVPSNNGQFILVLSTNRTNTGSTH
jgi:hypothetical protein